MRPIDCEIQCACGSALFYPCNSTFIRQCVGIYFYCVFPAFHRTKKTTGKSARERERRRMEGRKKESEISVQKKVERKEKEKNNHCALIMFLALLF